MRENVQYKKLLPVMKKISKNLLDNIDTSGYDGSSYRMIDGGQPCLHKVMSDSFSAGTSHYSSTQPCIR